MSRRTDEALSSIAESLGLLARTQITRAEHETAMGAVQVDRRDAIRYAHGEGYGARHETRLVSQLDRLLSRVDNDDVTVDQQLLRQARDFIAATVPLRAEPKPKGSKDADSRNLRTDLAMRHFLADLLTRLGVTVGPEDLFTGASVRQLAEQGQQALATLKHEHANATNDARQMRTQRDQARTDLGQRTRERDTARDQTDAAHRGNDDIARERDAVERQLAVTVRRVPVLTPRSLAIHAEEGSTLVPATEDGRPKWGHHTHHIGHGDVLPPLVAPAHDYFLVFAPVDGAPRADDAPAVSDPLDERFTDTRRANRERIERERQEPASRQAQRYRYAPGDRVAVVEPRSDGFEPVVGRGVIERDEFNQSQHDQPSQRPIEAWHVRMNVNTPMWIKDGVYSIESTKLRPYL